MYFLKYFSAFSYEFVPTNDILSLRVLHGKLKVWLSYPVHEELSLITSHCF